MMNLVGDTTQVVKWSSRLRCWGHVAGKTKDVEIVVPLKYLSNIYKTLETPLINFELSLQLTCAANSAITNSTSEGTFSIIDTKLYIPLVTLLTPDSSKLLVQLKSGFKRIISWNKYQSKISMYK